jgi:hypothetical protein
MVTSQGPNSFELLQELMFPVRQGSIIAGVGTVVGKLERDDVVYVHYRIFVEGALGHVVTFFGMDSRGKRRFARPKETALTWINYVWHRTYNHCEYGLLRPTH